MIISNSDLLRMRNILGKKIIEENKTHILCSITFLFLFFEIRADYEIMLKNILEPDRLQMTIWRMRFGCWITKATDTFSE